MNKPNTNLPEEMRTTKKAKKENHFFTALCFLATWSSVVVLIVLLAAVVIQSWGWFDWQFVTSFDSYRPKKAGIFAGIMGTFWIILFTAMMTIPIGIGAAIYLEEYSRDNWLTQFIRINIANLSGVPSVVYGILGLTVFVRMFGLFGPEGYFAEHFGFDASEIEVLGASIPLPLGRTVLAGSMTLSLLILPVVIIASQEALRAVPSSLRHASLALGATKWQTIRDQVLPAALPGIMTGIILAISRAIGETAPLLIIGAATFTPFAPGEIDSIQSLREHPQGIVEAPFDTFTVVPILVFNWVRQAKQEYQNVAAAGILVLLIILLALNGLAVLIRNYANKHVRW